VASDRPDLLAFGCVHQKGFLRKSFSCATRVAELGTESKMTLRVPRPP
jgi:hypothetical protein